MTSEQQRQQALDAMKILDTPPDERVDRITRLAQELFDVPMVSVTLLDRDRQWRKSQIGLGGQEAPRDDAFCDVTIRQSGTLVVEDAAQDPRFSQNPFVIGDPNLRFYAGHPLQAPNGEQVGTLCVLDTRPRSMDAKRRELLKDLALWVQVELARQQEVDHAALVQRALTPRTVPDLPGYTIATGAQPAGDISGDFYDLYRTQKGVRFTLADVMGKGVGAGIIASGVRGALRSQSDRDLVPALTGVDDLLSEELADMNIFVTAFHAELSCDTGELNFIDAGHNLGFILRNGGEFEHLDSSSLPMGMGLEADYAATATALAPGDMFLCCSDGLLDVLDPDDPFAEVAELLSELSPAEAVREGLARAVGRHAPDDVTIIIIRRDA